MVLLAIEELGLDFVDFGGVEAIAALVGAVEHGAAEQVPQFALVEGLTLARLDEITLDHDIGIAVQLDLQSFAEFAGVVAGHVCLSRFAFFGGLVMVGFAAMAVCTLADQPHTFSPGRADWQSVLAEGIRSPGELCRLLGLEPALAAEAERAAAGQPLLVPRPYLARIRPGDPADPLLLQVLPRAAEMAAAAGYGADPLGEADAMCGPRMLRKYQGRILILASGSCAVHCRYCFRRHFLGARSEERGVRGEGRVESGESRGQWPVATDQYYATNDRCPTSNPQSLIPNPSAIGHRRNPLPEGEGTSVCPSSSPEGEGTIGAIAADRSIHEVILSGGDPLTLPDERLARLAGELAEIPHLRRLRIHTRLPVMIPQRVNDSLLSWIRGCRLSPVMVVQVNHPAEIDADVALAFGRLAEAGIPVLNQSVLLRGVNDRADVLAELCERLVDLRVMPYYLHQLDAVAGAAHFEVAVARGVALVEELRRRLPGYAVPRYVRETPGGTSKEILA